MATADPLYDPAIGGSTPPVVIDGTGLATTVPLLIKTAKSQSGVELQGTASTVSPAYMLNNSAGVAKAGFGLVGTIGDLYTSSGVGYVALVFDPAQQLTIAPLGGGRVIEVSATSVAVYVTQTFGSAAKLAIAASNSLTTSALQIAGDPNTGGGQIHGADTFSGVAGGTEVWSIAANAMGVFTKVAAPAVQQASGANLTNSVTSGGTDDTIANYTDLTIYANDSAAIRNDIYQLARKVKQINDALRLFGWLT